MIERLDHINIRTARLDAMVAWYVDMLGLVPGPRPPFPFPGAWLYAGDYAIVHLVGVEAEPTDPGQDLRLEHGAFRATGYDALIARLDAAGARREVVKVPGFPIVQVNVWDPDGNHLHVDFHSDEAPGVV
jgi:catechol 2,3-dioxygenase-like lactoylglutathione lyase family enzyme